jgi:glycosyltransferase involved in cell wall biosynthesis
MEISAILPVYNGAQYIDQALPKILENLNSSDELVIINNGSTDNSIKMLSRWSNLDSRINLLNLKSPGLVSALNIGITESKNNWIARFDIDDVYSPKRIKLQRNAINEESVAIFSDYEFISNRNKGIGIVPSAISAPAVSVSLISSQRTAHPSVMFSKIAFESIGGYQEIDFPAEDLSLWLKLSRVGELSSIPQKLLQYRLNFGSVSAQNRNLITNKTLLLYKSIGINKKDINDTFASIDSILKEYDQFSYNGLRKVLMLRELMLLKNLDQLTTEQVAQVNNLKRSKLLKEIFKINNYLEFSYAFYMKQKRDKYRRKL